VDNVDHIIDDVARDMTSSPIDSGFVRRVEVRIANERSMRRRIWTQPALLAPLAATCVLLVAVFVARERRPAIQTRPAPAHPVVVAPEPAAVTTSRVAASPAAPGRGQRNPRVAPSPAGSAIEIAPLQIERLDVMPIVQAQQIEIEIDPIAIARIEIAPMP
jgi:hypothetical protein